MARGSTRVLLVCTGNICRSPMAAAFLREQLRDIAPSVAVSSAGLLYDGRLVAESATRAMQQRGLDISEHRSRRVSSALLDQIDLLIGMEPRHVREAVALRDAIWPSSFTLRELAGRAAAVTPRSPGEPLDVWIARVGGGRRRTDLLHDRAELSVPDPYHQSEATFDQTVDEIERLLKAVVAAAWPAGVEPQLVPALVGEQIERSA